MRIRLFIISMCGYIFGFSFAMLITQRCFKYAPVMIIMLILILYMIINNTKNIRG